MTITPNEYGDYTPDDAFDSGDRALKEAGLWFPFAVWDLMFIAYVRRLRQRIMNRG